MNAWRESAVWMRWRAQWSSSRVLRVGAWTIGGLLWVQSLLMLGDVAANWQKGEQAVREELAQMQTLAREKAWPQRADDARQQVAALRALLWPDADRGLAEASTQDWVRGVAAKAGLVVRDLSLVRSAVVPAAAAASGVPGAQQAVRLRMIADLDRVSLMGFLAELARNEHVVIVDRLVLRPAAQPPAAELELRMPIAAGPGSAK